MVPQGANSAPIQTLFLAQSGAAPISSAPLGTGTPVPGLPSRAPPRHRCLLQHAARSGASHSAPTGIPASVRLAARRPTSSWTGWSWRCSQPPSNSRAAWRPEQRTAASLSEPQRITPRRSPPGALSPGQVRLAPGRCGPGRAGRAPWLELRQYFRPALQVGLWEPIAQAREKQGGDSAGAALARQKATGQLLMDRRSMRWPTSCC